ncbi:beta-ketoadipyl CoA thiolase [Marinococcus halophilus]|uniref:acetyl-CoA C-acyltransferase n=1 Tax=Marinococcus halophilus TaxID=1371 RepID=A0A510Y9B8_MARHA|nr:acetyl-CoA C-acyltransferase [Marinococcus halophilus]OZT79057.1 beta-ketoadipyl CoA thiolase [Marinococcus halophilus]GEK59959.1 acetyl-CoA acetyltransferase [Marinococcus halophilus]
MESVVIVDALRTPIGRYNGALKHFRPDDLASYTIKELIERQPSLPTDEIDDVIFGNANGAGEENRNVARMGALLAGLPTNVSGTTINRLCGSSLDAVSMGARSILSGEAEVIIAGGVESMSRAPFVMAKPEKEFPRGDMTLQDTTIGWRFVNPKMQEMYGTDSMPGTAENVAQQYKITREEQDAFAFRSQTKAKQAMDENKFNQEIMSLIQQQKRGDDLIIDTDEHPRPNTTMEKLAKLPAIFTDGTVTAGNASGVNDGAAALLMMTASKAKEWGLTPLVRFRASTTAGVEPSVMGLGPISSTKKLMHKHQFDVSDFGLVELNEAFASQSLECIRQLQLDPELVNVNGGAIAFGHPLGASGAKILTSLIYEMKRRDTELGLATMCIGVGQGISLVIENVH